MIITQTIQNTSKDCVPALVSAHFDGIKTALFFDKKLNFITTAGLLKINSLVDKIVDYLFKKSEPNDKNEILVSINSNTADFPIVRNTVRIIMTGDEQVFDIDFSQKNEVLCTPTFTDRQLHCTAPHHL
jgi:hypothetical protein